MRVFLALPRDRMWIESAREFVSRVRKNSPDASWTREESWHVTLKFLGEIDAAMAREYAASIAPHALAAVAGEMPRGDAVVFPPRGPARVLGIGFGPSPVLESIAELAGRSEAAARALGLPSEDRGFHPHVTLARIRHPWPPAAVEEFQAEAGRWALPPWNARSVVLYESRLGREGAIHTPLEEWSFAGGERGVRA